MASKKVMLQDNYNGCFKEFKGKILTIESQTYCEEEDSCYWYKIKEFSKVEKYHLVKSRDFKRLDGTKIS